ncbi:MAG: homoserine kinase [Gammaproteobacteria bacterium]|nr:homoserine kinase [Gammaproteobacteria bacterium]
MAVITELHRSDIDQILDQYGLGAVETFRETTHGIENSNYFLSIQQDNSGPDRTEYVLTVLERETDNRSLVMAALERCFERGLPVPQLVSTNKGSTTVNHQGREMLICERLPGNHVICPTTQHCAAIGRFLARLHLILEPLAIDTAYERKLEWIKKVATQCQNTLSKEDSRILHRSINLVDSILDRNEIKAMPQGIIHGDLFRDNVLFNEHGLCGVLDFHHAGYGFWLFDLAIAINDWCTENGSLDREKTFAVVREYNSIRRLTQTEYWSFPHFLLYAAVCFWLSRLVVSVRDDLPDGFPRKDPEEFAEITRTHLKYPFQIHELVTCI